MKHGHGSDNRFSTTFGTRDVRMARALLGGIKQHVPTSKEIAKARHLMREGAGWSDIHVALGWDCTLRTTCRRLIKCGFPHELRQDRFRNGGTTHFPNDDCIDTLSYRPKQIGAVR